MRKKNAFRKQSYFRTKHWLAFMYTDGQMLHKTYRSSSWQTCDIQMECASQDWNSWTKRPIGNASTLPTCCGEWERPANQSAILGALGPAHRLKLSTSDALTRESPSHSPLRDEWEVVSRRVGAAVPSPEKLAHPRHCHGLRWQHVWKPSVRQRSSLNSSGPRKFGIFPRWMCVRLWGFFFFSWRKRLTKAACQPGD